MYEITNTNYQPMQELIIITEQNGSKAVSARELYEFLGYNKAVWSRWYQKNILENEFAFENIDYQTLNIMLNGNETKDFAISIDFAKKLSMKANTARGEEARQYFIECEKQLRAKEQAPKVLFADTVIGSQSSCLIGELAKLITQKGYEIGEKRLFKWLRENHYLGKKGEYYNIPNQQYIEQGLFELKKGTRSGNGGVMHTTITPKVTGKGQVYFVNKFLRTL